MCVQVCLKILYFPEKRKRNQTHKNKNKKTNPKSRITSRIRNTEGEVRNRESPMQGCEWLPRMSIEDAVEHWCELGMVKDLTQHLRIALESCCVVLNWPRLCCQGLSLRDPLSVTPTVPWAMSGISFYSVYGCCVISITPSFIILS